MVSKVAMSICALMVVSILSGAFGMNMFQNDASELDSILRDFCSVIDMASRSRAESAIEWRVPFLSTGERFSMTIDRGVVKAKAGEESAVEEPGSRIHTWVWNGERLNDSVVEELDEASFCTSSSSGHALEILTQIIMLGNEQTLLVFVFADD